ncbi:dihydrofolate reductase family protein [Actinomycetospora rhizophila]|uniref:Dihydrofolate reductase family protein n=1 Tax=Actinomycetospora rhizophila TaxID=1416876 RepID=A0ABV9ZJC4_9PSEU
MRQLVVTVIATLDGFVAGPGGDVMVMPFDEGFDDYAGERIRAAGTLLAGRTTYEDFRAYWPGVADDPAKGEIERGISRVHNTLEKVVVSDSLVLEPGSTWADITRVVARADATATVRELKESDGGDILVFGSFTTWNPLLLAGLVDELHVLVGPALLGAGVPLLSEPTRVPLRLLEARRLPGSSLVLHRHAALA